MKPVHQTKFAVSDGALARGVEPGNCLAACVASILELPIEAVPNFVQGKGPWVDRLSEWLKARGLAHVFIPHHSPVEYPARSWCIAVGRSPRHAGSHAVVARTDIRGRVRARHDPHPEGGMLAGKPSGVLFFVASEPAQKGSTT